MPDIAFAQEIVLQHRAQGGRERHRELERNVVVHQPSHHLQERDVSFGDRLEQPVFFQKMFMFRMPNERQVGVKNEREVTSHCRFLYSVIPSGARNLPKGEGSHRLLGATFALWLRSLAFARDDNQSVRQKSCNRSSPFLMMSMLVA